MFPWLQAYTTQKPVTRIVSPDRTEIMVGISEPAARRPVIKTAFPGIPAWGWGLIAVGVLLSVGFPLVGIDTWKKGR